MGERRTALMGLIIAGQTKKILIAEDDALTQRLLKSMLDHHPAFSERPLDVLFAVNGEEAVRLFEQTTPDVVLLDMLMPKRDGFEVCETIRATEHGQRVPILAASAIWKEEQMRDRLAGSLGVTFVSKPFDAEELVEAICLALEQTATADP